jgi:predicted nucleic acid-binding protein
MSLPGLSARRVFTDTSAYFALADPRDENHAAAVVIAEQLATRRRHLFTTNFVLAETHALLLARRGRELAARILVEIDRSSTAIVRARAADEQRAREIIARYRDKDFSLTDAISFAIMERLGIGQAFTFDRDFAQYGFTAVMPN